MIHKVIAIALSLLTYLLVAGCVTAVDSALPYTDLPQITLATEVRLVASPAHPTAYLAADPIPAGTDVQVVGADTDAQFLLVMHDKTVGWMPTFFSRTSVGTLKAALVVDPLDARCTTYRDGATDVSKVWISTESGAAIVQGVLYRTERTEQFSNTKLMLNIDGNGVVVASDYIHAPLTSSSALILFTFAVADLAPKSRLHFTLTDAGDEIFAFQATLFSNACPDAVNVLGSPFTNELPVGQEKLLANAPAVPTITDSDMITKSVATPTAASSVSGVTTTTVGVDAPQGEILLDLLSTRAGPSFDYGASGPACKVSVFPFWRVFAARQEGTNGT